METLKEVVKEIFGEYSPKEWDTAFRAIFQIIQGVLEAYPDVLDAGIASRVKEGFAAWEKGEPNPMPRSISGYALLSVSESLGDASKAIACANASLERALNYFASAIVRAEDINHCYKGSIETGGGEVNAGYLRANIRLTLGEIQRTAKYAATYRAYRKGVRTNCDVMATEAQIEVEKYQIGILTGQNPVLPLPKISISMVPITTGVEEAKNRASQECPGRWHKVPDGCVDKHARGLVNVWVFITEEYQRDAQFQRGEGLYMGTYPGASASVQNQGDISTRMTPIRAVNGAVKNGVKKAGRILDAIDICAQNTGEIISGVIQLKDDKRIKPFDLPYVVTARYA